jgi:hypothetical protein
MRRICFSMRRIVFSHAAHELQGAAHLIGYAAHPLLYAPHRLAHAAHALQHAAHPRSLCGRIWRIGGHARQSATTVAWLAALNHISHLLAEIAGQLASA